MSQFIFRLTEGKHSRWLRVQAPDASMLKRRTGAKVSDGVGLFSMMNDDQHSRVQR
jgi:hypothetical protein